MCLDEVEVARLSSPSPHTSNSTCAGMSRNYRREKSKIKKKKKWLKDWKEKPRV